MCVCVYICIYIYIYIYTHIYTYIYICVCVCVFVHSLHVCPLRRSLTRSRPLSTGATLPLLAKRARAPGLRSLHPHHLPHLQLYDGPLGAGDRIVVEKGRRGKMCSYSVFLSSHLSSHVFTLVIHINYLVILQRQNGQLRLGHRAVVEKDRRGTCLVYSIFPGLHTCYYMYSQMVYIHRIHRRFIYKEHTSTRTGTCDQHPLPIQWPALFWAPSCR